MKLLLFICSVGFCILSTNSEEFNVEEFNSDEFIITDEHLNQDYLANAFAEIAVKRIFEKRQEQVLWEKNGRIPIIPGPIFPPSIPLPEGTLNFSSSPIIGFYQQIDSTLEGLHTLSDDLVIKIQTPLLISYTLNLSELAVRGNYSMDLALNVTHLGEIIPGFPIEEPEFLTFEGEGRYDIGIQNISLKLGLGLYIKNGIIDNVTTSLDLSLRSASLYFENFLFMGDEEGGTAILELLSQLLPVIIGDLWGLVRNSVEPVLDLLLTGLLKGCEVLDLINGDLTCTGLVNPPPTTTAAPTTTTTEPTTIESLPTQPSTELTTQSHGEVVKSGFTILFISTVILFFPQY